LSKLSAGILVYDVTPEGELKVLLVHAGGPFWKNKDEGAWSIPKGEYEEGEDALSSAKREFTEETGNVLPEKEFISLQPVKIKSGKVISAWAVEASFDPCFIKSNYFEVEWPPKSGKKQLFPETDKAEWFTLEVAKTKINDGQKPFIEQLKTMLSGKDKQ
jgi:predicted NUDIX family NTP pyrophosphohydrolase